MSAQRLPHRALLVIDPQNDFVDPSGALYVKGAERDAEALARLIESPSAQLSDLIISLDSHHRLDISHPLWFRDAEGRAPAPFTVITSADLRAGRWRALEGAQERTLAYLEALEREGRYPHVIWPEHCLMGGAGQAMFPLIFEVAQGWVARASQRSPQQIAFVSKGQNPWTEHFSAVKAEVPDPHDPHTHTRRDLIERLLVADEVWVAGWARSHCVANTVRDLVRFGGESLARKMTLVTDTMSDVPGFEEVGERFVREAQGAGVSLLSTSQLLGGGL
jgi:nicotinamidase/pyrazinamidase